jgi:GT2 family glycosyltransferase
VVVLPETTDATTGEPSSTWGWCGALIPRVLVDVIGVPRAELFYGFEDQDYLLDRAQQAGFPLLREPDAHADLVRREGLRRPVWHYYYLPRNATYQYLYRRRHVRFVNRVKRLVYFHLQFARQLARERDRRGARALLYLRGVVDGLFARLGRRVEPRDEARPNLDRRIAQSGSAATKPASEPRNL